jgi:hypothetical protein
VILREAAYNAIFLSGKFQDHFLPKFRNSVIVLMVVRKLFSNLGAKASF